MAVNTTGIKTARAACNGSVTEFTFDFKIFEDSDLKVYKITTADDTRELLTLTADYTVSATNDDFSEGGTVTTVQTYASGYEILIVRDVENLQETDYVHGDDLPSEVLENDLDRRCMKTQELVEKLSRALIFPPEDPTTLSGELPSQAERLGKFPYFDATYGEMVMVDALTPGEATVTDFTKTLLDDADADAFLATLMAALTNHTASVNSIKTVSSANYPVLDSDGYSHILVTTGASDRTITLPTAADNSGRELFIKKVDSGAGEVIVDGEGAEKINQTATWQLGSIDAYIHIICDGTGWHVLEAWEADRIYWHAATFTQSTPTQNQWYAVTDFILALPTGGVWEIEVACHFYGADTGSDGIAVLTVADGSAEEDDAMYSMHRAFDSGGNSANSISVKRFQRTSAAGVTLYVNIKTTTAGVDNIHVNDGTVGPGYLKAKRVG